MSYLQPTLLAETSLRSIRYDAPETFEGWLLTSGVGAALLAYVAWMYWRDTRQLSRAATVWLLLLRVGVLAALAVVWFNPQERTQQSEFLPSKVAILVDTSASMGFPESLPASPAAQDEASVRSRNEAVVEVLSGSPLIEELRQRHEITIYTFDTMLRGPHRRLYARNDEAAKAAAENKRKTTGAVEDDSEEPDADLTAEAIDWEELLRPSGYETRLGEALQAAVKVASGRTLSGIVIITDGASNAGMEPDSARDFARSRQVRLLTVGVGSTERLGNVRLVNLQAPTEVQVNDAFDITALIEGQGSASREVEVRLLMKEGPDTEPVVVETRREQLGADGVPTEVVFEQMPTAPARRVYAVEVHPVDGRPESSQSDNVQDVAIEFTDRPTHVLVVAGGPMRDYHFVRNMLYRHPRMTLDIWLQSVDVEDLDNVSQESDTLLARFPNSPAEIQKYDVILFFDPDWQAIPQEGRDLLVDWVSTHAGGAVFVAGDVFTPELARAGDALQSIRDLYPVFLASYVLDQQYESDSATPWKLGMKREGENAGFLQLGADPQESRGVWEEFDGIFRTYPTAGAKAGATVYAEFSDTDAQSEHGPHIVLASQFFGAGRTMYVGSPEIWRLRQLSEEYYDRFWTKAIREVGQARLKRGASRALLVPERNEYALGETVRVRARMLDPQYKPLVQDAVWMTVIDPRGKALSPARQLLPDKGRPGEYVGDFRASLPGTYQLKVPVPETKEDATADLKVVEPVLESLHPEQNAAVLTRLAGDTGGAYLPLSEAAERLPGLLDDKHEDTFVDERLRTLWDRDWLLFLMVGLLSIEWLTRKLLKLA